MYSNQERNHTSGDPAADSLAKRLKRVNRINRLVLWTTVWGLCSFAATCAAECVYTVKHPAGGEIAPAKAAPEFRREILVLQQEGTPLAMGELVRERKGAALTLRVPCPADFFPTGEAVLDIRRQNGERVQVKSLKASATILWVNGKTIREKQGDPTWSYASRNSLPHYLEYRLPPDFSDTFFSLLKKGSIWFHLYHLDRDFSFTIHPYVLEEATPMIYLNSQGELKK